MIINPIIPTGSAQFRVVVKVEGREPREHFVIAPIRDDGFEGPARTRAQMAWCRMNDLENLPPLHGEMVEYEVERV